MSEVEKLFEGIKAVPSDYPVDLTLSYGQMPIEFGFTVARVGDPSKNVKNFLYGICVYCSMSFEIQVDLSKIKSEIFG